MKKCLVIIGGYNPGHNRKIDSCLFLPIGYKYVFCDLNFYDFRNAVKYDCLIIFTSLESATPEQLFYITEYAKVENRKLLFIHEACIYDRANSSFRKFLGVRFKYHDPYGKIGVVKCSKASALIGCSDQFYVFDELYYYDESVSWDLCEILLRDSHTENVLMYSKVFEGSGSIIYYISIGHDKSSLNSKNFIQIIYNILYFP